MLDYLVTSKTRRALLKLLWLDGVNGTASELAQKSGAAFAGVYRELKAMAESDLAEVEWSNGRRIYAANRAHPMTHMLRKLLNYQDTEKQEDLEKAVKLRENLAFLGLPVNARKTAPENSKKIESLLVEGSNLAAKDASVARAFPVLLSRVSASLDFDALKYESWKHGNKHRVGFLLELAGELGEDQCMKEAANKFLDSRYKRQRPFFQNQSKYSLRLAQERTPELARKWGWLMNMGMDAFESTYKKFDNESVPA